MKRFLAHLASLALFAAVVAGPVLGNPIASRFALFGVWSIAVLTIILTPVVILVMGASEGKAAESWPTKGRAEKLFSRLLGFAFVGALVYAGWMWTAAIYVASWIASWITGSFAEGYKRQRAEKAAGAEATA